MRIQAAVCAIYVLLGIGQSRADSYPPYQDQRTIDPKGKYYVVIERAGAAIHDLPWGPVKITVAEAREGSTPVRQAKCRVIDRDGRFETIRNEAIAVRSGDLVHGRIELTNAPQHVLVSANGLGLITLGIYGPNYNALKDGAAVSVYDLTGKVRHSLSLEELL